jgi:hypothetical protein
VSIVLPKGKDLLYRGTEGFEELISACKTDRLGDSPFQKRKEFHHDIREFVRDNNSNAFLSATPCPQTVRPYSVGLSLYPISGFIMCMGLPKVFTRPQKSLLLNQEWFEKDDERRVNQVPVDQAISFQTIVEMTKNNNETTIILGHKKGDNWGLNVSENVHTILRVSGPGKILGKFFSSEMPALIKTYINPDFKKRVWSIEIVNGPKEDYEKMNTRAGEQGLIKDDERLLFIEDAAVLADNPELNSLDSTHKIGETHVFKGVPKDIPIGDKRLVEHVISVIEKLPTLEQIPLEPNPNLEP